MSKSPMMRALSVMLSVCMVLGMIYLPASAEEAAAPEGMVAAIGTEYYETLQEAVDAAEAGDTITLLANISLPSSGVEITKDLTIELNGKNITSEGDVFVIPSGTLTVKGEGEITANTDGMGDANAAWVKGGKLVVYGGTWSCGGDSDVAGTHTGDMIYTNNGGTVEIYGGYFKYVESVWTLNENDANRGTIKVYGGQFEGWDPANNVSEGAGTNFVADGYAALPDLNGNFVVGSKPTATVNNLGEMTVPADNYYIYDGSLTQGTEDMPLNFVMQFVADQDATDMQTSPFAGWYADFVITFENIEGGSFNPAGCYLAGFYGETESWDGMWVKIPVEGVLESIDEDVRYPVMMGVGMPQLYDYICSGVQAFSCAMYIPEEILTANPDLKVKLELNIVDSSNDEKALEALVSGKNIYNVSEEIYEAEDFQDKPAPSIEIDKENKVSINIPSSKDTFNKVVAFYVNDLEVKNTTGWAALADAGKEFTTVNGKNGYTVYTDANNLPTLEVGGTWVLYLYYNQDGALKNVRKVVPVDAPAYEAPAQNTITVTDKQVEVSVVDGCTFNKVVAFYVNDKPVLNTTGWDALAAEGKNYTTVNGKNGYTVYTDANNLTTLEVGGTWVLYLYYNQDGALKYVRNVVTIDGEEIPAKTGITTEGGKLGYTLAEGDSFKKIVAFYAGEDTVTNTTSWSELTEIGKANGNAKGFTVYNPGAELPELQAGTWVFYLYTTNGTIRTQVTI